MRPRGSRPRFVTAAVAAAALGLLVFAGAAWALGANSGGSGFFSALWVWFTASAHWQGGQGIPVRMLEHIYYTGVSMAIAMAIALPVGVGFGHLGRGGLIAANVANIGRAVPELGVVILVFLLVGYGDMPIFVALVALAVPPMVTNSYVGMRSVDPDVRQAAAAAGMTGWQTLWRAELPIAVPLVMAGVRTSAVQVVSTATLAAYVGLGGLGRYIIDGLSQRDIPQVVGGGIVVALLAIAVETILAQVQKWIVSPGLTQ